MFVSMRSKFVLIMSVLILAAAVALALISRGILVSDKESYLYEDIRQAVALDSLTIVESSKKWKAVAKSVFSNSIIQKQEDSVAKLQFPRVFFADNSNLIDFSVFRKGSKDFTLLEKVENPITLKDERLKKELLITESEVISFLKKAYANLSLIEVVKSNKKASAPVEIRIGLYDTKTRFGGIFRFLLSKNLENIKTKKNYKRVLLNRDGKVLFEKNGASDDSQSAPIVQDPSFLTSMVGRSESEGVENGKVFGEKYIIGFSQIPSLNLTSLLIQSEEHAYAVQGKLFLEMAKVAVAFVFMTALLIFVFTDSIVKAINSLNKALSESLAGNYQKAEDGNVGDEVGKLVKGFNQFVSIMEKETKKLSAAKANLEKKVEGRTTDLKNSTDFMNAMIETLDQGLFIFTRSGKILPMYTSRTEDFLGRDINLRNAKELLPFSNVEVGESVIKDMFESKDDFELAAQKAPQELVIEEPKYTYTQIDYYPLRSEEGFVQFVGVVITDRTEVERLNFEAADYKVRFQTLHKVAKSKTAFLNGFQIYEEFRQHLIAASENSDLNIVKNEVVTRLGKIKKFIKNFGDTDFQNIFQNLEFDILNSVEAESLSDTFTGNVYHFDEKFSKMHQLFSIIMGDALIDKEARQEVKRTKLLEYKDSLIQQLEDPNNPLIEKFDIEFVKIPIEGYFKKYSEVFQSEAQRNGKYVMPIEFENGDILIDRLRYQSVFESFHDLFVFIAQEGIEDRIIREEQGKEPLGKVRVEFEVVRKKVEIRVIDDGCGINPAKLRETMEAKGFSEEEIADNDDQIMSRFYDLYLKSFKEVVEANGGAAIFASKQGEGTTYKFRFPLQ